MIKINDIEPCENQKVWLLVVMVNDFYSDSYREHQFIYKDRPSDQFIVNKCNGLYHIEGGFTMQDMENGDVYCDYLLREEDVIDAK